MQYTKKMTKVGGSLFILIPNDMLKYLNLNEGDKIIIQDDIGNHGRFVSMWKKEEKDDNGNTRAISQP